jgi:putative transposase
VVWSLVYLALRRILELDAVRCRSAEAKEIEILVLRHELAVLRRQHRRPQLQSTDRALRAALSRLLTWARWSVFLVQPETLLPPVPDEVQLVVRLARENPTMGLPANPR